MNQDLSQLIANLSPEQRALLEKRLKEKNIKHPSFQTQMIGKRQSSAVIPLSFAQQRLWFIQQLEPENNSYNVPSAFRLRGKLEVEILERTLNEIVKRHEMLRTTFTTDSDRQPIQVVKAFEPFSLPMVDLQGIADAETEIQRIVRTESLRPFNLSESLLRLILLKRSETEHILLIATHHIVCDRWSIGIFLREMTTLYNGFLKEAGGDPPLPPLGKRGKDTEKAFYLPSLPIQYGDWSIWQRQWLQGEVLEKQINYWQQKLGQDLPILDLPTKRSRPLVPSYKGKPYPIALSPALSNALKALSAKERVTLFTLLLSAFKVLLCRYTEQDDIVIGTEIANRDRREMEGLIGLLVNTLVLRTDLSGNPTFQTVLQRVREVTLGAYAHQDLPFEKLVEVLNPDRHLSQIMPLFQVKFDFQLATVKPLELSDLSLERLSGEQETVKYELRLNLQDTNEGINGQIEYSTDLFEEATIARMAEHFQVLLEGIVANPKQRLSELPLLSTVEQETLLMMGTSTTQDYPNTANIPQLFEEQVKRTPDAVALRFGKEILTYQELNTKANQLAHYLQKLGVRPEVKVGICVERSPQMVIGLLAVLKAGGAYIPLDPAYPQDRIDFIIKDSQISVLLGRDGIDLEKDCAKIAQESKENPPNNLHPDNLAYVIYTSGSTGRPKGVAIAHRNTVALLDWARKTFSPELLQGVLASTSICFDLSVFELFVPLCWGYQVILAENILDLPNLAAREEITLINTVPSAIAQLLRIKGIPISVKGINLAGEALSHRLVEELEKLSHIQSIFNLYGPSEDTTYSTYTPVKSNAEGVVTIGKGISNTQTYILDRYLNLVPQGVTGELYLSGAGIARGYLGRSPLTAQRFMPNPFVGKKQGQRSREQGVRLYKTGDLVRYDGQGNLEFLGRRDNQVKVRGYRLELGEIEAALSEHPGMVENAVMVWQKESNNQRLVAYLVTDPPLPPLTKGGSPASPKNLRHFLVGKLPQYAIPTTFIELPALPRLPNGKLDRKSLPMPETLGRSLDNDYVEPQTETERTIAEIWQNALKVDKIGIHDNFFELGGHSLLGINVIAEISERLGVKVPLRSLFEQPTVAGLEAKISEKKEIKLESANLPTLVAKPHERDEPFPLTDIQQAYLIGRSAAFELGNVATHGYREIETVGLTVQQVEEAFQMLIQRHDMLRVVVDEEGQQRVLPEVPPYKIKTLDLREESKETVATELEKLRDRLSHQMFPTDRFPLFEIQGVLLPGERVRFMASFEVLIGDAWSFQILGQEFAQILQNSVTSLWPLSISFRDYVIAEKAWRDSEGYQRSLSYWQNRLATLPPSPELPLTKRLGAVSQPHFVRRSGKLKTDDWQKLKDKASQLGITPSGLLLAAFAEVLTTWSKSPEFTLNLTLFNRLPIHPEINHLIGDFTSSLLLTVNNKEQDAFSTRARRIQGQLWEDLDHRHVSGVKVLRELSRLRGGKGEALMPVVFTSTLTQTSQQPSSSRTWEAEVVYSVSQTSQVYLDHQVSEIDGELIFNWDAIEELFPVGLLDDMFRAYHGLLERLAKDETLWETPTPELLPPEQIKIITGINNTETAFKQENCLLHELFFEQVSKNPEKIAVIAPQLTLTYQQLSDRILTLAHHLRTLGVQSNQLVAVMMEKGWEQIVAALGILTAGGAYVPIDPELPLERRYYLLEETKVNQVLTQSWLDVEIQDSLERIDIDTLEPNNTLDLFDSIQQPDDLAYVIYTSGSTGVPKGVAIAHQGAVNTILDINQKFDISAKDQVIALSTLNFDLSVYDIFGILAAGGTLVMPEHDRRQDPSHWDELLSQHNITIWNSVPALMQMLLETEASNEDLRVVLLSGDWLPLNLSDRIRSRFPASQVISLGGATEASIWSIFYPIDRVDPSWKSIPYGRPLANQHFYVFHESLTPCPLWVTGQLYIGGKGLAEGYWQNKEKTDASFIIHPQTQERLYKTGDLGRYLPDGNIEFLGREDYQVKIRGYRIELGEIETALEQHPAIKEAVVTAVGNSRENQQLAAYIVPNQSSGVPDAYDPKEQEGVIRDPIKRMEFKLKQPGVKGLNSYQTRISLPKTDVNEGIYLRRQSYRQFLNEPISLQQLGQFLSSLSPIQLKDSPLPKYRYGSAGSLYPVQVYLLIKSETVTGLEGGFYYYHPLENSLVLLNSQIEFNAEVYGNNQVIYEGSAFSLFLMGELDAIQPLYGEKARDLCLLEAGYISQLLMETAPDQELGLCPIGALDFEPLRNLLALEESQILLHSFVGGKIDLAWTKQWSQPKVETKMESITDKLQQYLQQKLPDYMIPKSYTILKTLPLTANGKIDRNALPKPKILNTTVLTEFVPPQTKIQEKLATIWQKYLEIEEVGIYDNFFDLGGNSLLVTQVISKIRQTFQVELPIQKLFETPTIAELEVLIQENKAVEGVGDRIEQCDREEMLEINNLEELSEAEIDDLLVKMLGEEENDSELLD
ncbi:peptide synthetase [Crocosphaera subtropica ATCC 51142]|uniref:Peptide synthetase n=1 Tax=Crocosphaera subtropica (strain ATCC 51142 / BH68) TaxID=43989 RepID=B1WWV2_CROS5|nr:non-ribosomal peptide synthetase [Crocosphaera subtropica]ACB52421.1 peptide synthetase [Crocosphaera subtropica ATCC 51142]